jgi:murein DD-endopeptidase
MKNITFLIIFILASSTHTAFAEKLLFPVDCQLGNNCYIQEYVDHAPELGGRDFTGGQLTHKDHAGTDITLVSYAEMDKNIHVVAAAPGTVIHVSNRYMDKIKKSYSTLSSSSCGNNVIIDHGNGWKTQYCHLKRFSVHVKPGQQVKAGKVIGHVGSSGFAVYPNLEFILMKDDKIMDPFALNLWASPIPYQATGLINMGISPEEPNYGALVKAPIKLDSFLTTTPIYPWVRIFGMPAETEQRFVFYESHGEVFRTIHLPPSNRFYPVWFSYTMLDAQNAMTIEQGGKWKVAYQIKQPNKEWQTMGEVTFSLNFFSNKSEILKRR